MMSEYIGRPISDVIAIREDMKVVVNNAGEAISGKQFDLSVTEILETQGMDGLRSLASTAPHILFVRNDGWVLAASPKLEQVAYNMWKDEWVGFVKCPNEFIEDIADYIPSERDF